MSPLDAQLTDALKDYVNEKLGSALSKVGRKVTRCDVTLNVDKNPSIEKNQEIEVVLSVKGTILRTKETTHDMYASIDAASDAVKRKLRKYKEKIIDAHRAGRPEAADFDAGEIEVRPRVLLPARAATRALIHRPLRLSRPFRCWERDARSVHSASIDLRGIS
jgi:ribosomal subunit interface protein